MHRAETQRRREKQNHELGALLCAVHAKGRLCQGSLLCKTAEMPFPCNTKLQLVCQPPLRGPPDASSFAGGASLGRLRRLKKSSAFQCYSTYCEGFSRPSQPCCFGGVGSSPAGRSLWRSLVSLLRMTGNWNCCNFNCHSERSEPTPP